METGDGIDGKLTRMFRLMALLPCVRGGEVCCDEGAVGKVQKSGG